MATLPGHPAHGSEELDRADEQVIWIALEQIDGEEISPACHAIMPLVCIARSPFEGLRKAVIPYTLVEDVPRRQRNSGADILQYGRLLHTTRAIVLATQGT
jgi:hypothetical protein